MLSSRRRSGWTWPWRRRPRCRIGHRRSQSSTAPSEAVRRPSRSPVARPEPRRLAVASAPHPPRRRYGRTPRRNINRCTLLEWKAHGRAVLAVLGRVDDAQRSRGDGGNVAGGVGGGCSVPSPRRRGCSRPVRSSNRATGAGSDPGIAGLVSRSIIIVGGRCGSRLARTRWHTCRTRSPGRVRCRMARGRASSWPGCWGGADRPTGQARRARARVLNRQR